MVVMSTSLCYKHFKLILLLICRAGRLESVFSFLEEGAPGVKVDRSGKGLLKVWKQQLLTFKQISPDMAEALIATYPSPSLLREVSTLQQSDFK